MAKANGNGIFTEKTYGPYTAAQMTEMGQEYMILDAQIKELAKRKDELNETIKSVLPAGEVTLIGNVIFKIKSYLRGTTDYKLVQNLVSEQIGLDTTKEIWDVATKSKEVVTLSVDGVSN
jgi:hypothetical protein